MFLPLLVIVSAIVALLATIIWFLVETKNGMFRPKNNTHYIVLRGGIFDHSVFGNVDSYPEIDSLGEVTGTTQKPIKGILGILDRRLYNWFGIRIFGIPFINKLGEVKVNYPEEIESISGHRNPDPTASGFDDVHPYRFVFKSDFQGGVNLKTRFTVSLKLEDVYSAWIYNGKFLDAPCSYGSGAVEDIAMTTSATEFLGQVLNPEEAKDKEKVQAAKAKSDGYRNQMDEALKKLNENVNRDDGSKKVKLSKLCGYSILSIKFNDVEPGDKLSEERIADSNIQSIEAIKTATAEQRVKTEEQEAKAVAVRITTEADAKATASLAVGRAQAKVIELTGKATARALKAKADATGGPETGIAESYSQALGELKNLSVLNVNGSGSGGTPLIFSLPNASTKPDNTAPKSSPTPPPTTPPAKP
jgi:hypothetical protein